MLPLIPTGVREIQGLFLAIDENTFWCLNIKKRIMAPILDKGQLGTKRSWNAKGLPPQVFIR